MPTSPPLSGRIAVVTGAGGGLGRGICAALARDGAAIAAVDRSHDRLASLSGELAQSGSRAIEVTADVSDEQSVRRMADEVERQLGPAAILVNNAAVYPRRPWSEVSVLEWDEVMAVNARGYFLCAKALDGALRASGHGRIVNVASTTFLQGTEQLVAYVASKGAVLGLTRTLARELGPAGVTVNAIAPGAFPTDAEKIHPDLEEYNRHVLAQQSIKRRGSPEDVGALVAFLAGDGASFISGQTVVIDGGWVLH